MREIVKNLSYKYSGKEIGLYRLKFVWSRGGVKMKLQNKKQGTNCSLQDDDFYLNTTNGLTNYTIFNKRRNIKIINNFIFRFGV